MPAPRTSDQRVAALVPVQPVADALLDRLVSTEAGPGLAAAVPLPRHEADPEYPLAGAGPAVLVHEIQNPGNHVGAIIRSALAFGARGVLAAGGADPWGPKAVRASAGAIHRLRVARTPDPHAAVAALDQVGVRLIAATAHDGAAPSAIDWSGGVALLLGSEVAGLPPELERRAERVTIPTTGRVESLSVAIPAASILLAYAFEAGRRAG